jgi:hypothetical protein
MKNLFLTTTFLLLCAGFALAQTAPSSNPSSGGTSSTQDQMGQQPSTSSTPTTPGTSSTPSTSGTQDTSQTGKQSTSADKGNKEKSITGCLESAGSSGQYMVKHKNKDITVVPSGSVSSEIANHVGHKVKLYGSWEQASASASTGDNTMASNTGSNLPQSDQPGAAKGSKSDMSKGGREFRADKIEMVSDTCGGSSKSKDTTGTTTPKPY